MVRQPSDWAEVQDFYAGARATNVDIQHILNSPEEDRGYITELANGKIPGTTHLIQLVQGTYGNGSEGRAALSDYLAEMNQADGMTIDWRLCAFGAEETPSLVQAARCGGKTRVGFENSLWNQNGSLAKDNAERVREVNVAIRAATREI
jgi:uncharacterized protein (DUF849 family)